MFIGVLLSVGLYTRIQPCFLTLLCLMIRCVKQLLFALLDCPGKAALMCPVPQRLAEVVHSSTASF